MRARARHPRARAVLGILVVELLASRAGATPAVCRDAVIAASARYTQSATKALASCRRRRLADCDADTRTVSTLARAAARLQSIVTQRCCGSDRICGTADDEPLAAIGWDAGYCPNLDRGECNGLITSAADVATCLVCIGNGAAGDLAAASATGGPASGPAGGCVTAIGKETARLATTTSKALARCWEARGKGTHANPCPEPGDGLAGPAIESAVARATTRLCKACGGAGSRVRRSGRPRAGVARLRQQLSGCHRAGRRDVRRHDHDARGPGRLRDLRHRARRRVRRSCRRARLRALPVGVCGAAGHVRRRDRVRERGRLPRRLSLSRQRLRNDPVLRRRGLQRGHRLRRRRGLPAVLHVRGLRVAPLRVPGLRVRRVRGVHRRRRARVPPALHPGLGLSSAARRVRELDLRRRACASARAPASDPARESRKALPRNGAAWEEHRDAQIPARRRSWSDRRVRPHGPPVRPSISRCLPRTPRPRRSARCPGPTISTSIRDVPVTATARCSTAAPRSDSALPSSRRTRPRSSRRSI